MNFYNFYIDPMILLGIAGVSIILLIIFLIITICNSVKLKKRKEHVQNTA